MTAHRSQAARPVRTFLRRLALQVVLSGTAMAAIHFGMRVAPEIGAFLAPPAETVAAVAPAVVRQAVPAAAENDRPPPFAADFAASAPSFDAAPVPQAAPERPAQPLRASVRPAAERTVQRFDACVPACPSRDPMLQAGTLLASAGLAEAAGEGQGTEFPEVPDDGIENRPASLLAMPGRALGAAGRTTRNVLTRVETLLPF